jgi:hypothetical protein
MFSRGNLGIICCVMSFILYKNFLIIDDIDCLLINLFISLFLCPLVYLLLLEIGDIDCL